MCAQKWPSGYRAAISITMDNMGEATELLRGTWPEDRTIGLHPSVTHALPNMLSILSQQNVRSTYFIEGWNADVYPGAIQAVRNSGHEVAFHGWQHEPWSTLSPEEEQDLIDRSLHGFSKLSLRMQGFRPPGGILTSKSPELLRNAGFTYCSPAGRHAAVIEQLVYLPFDWRGIDAYYYSEAFAGLRSAKGDQDSPMSPEMLARSIRALVDDVVERGGYTALLFHPHLEIDQDRIDAMIQVLEHVVGNPEIWCARCCDVAQWIVEHQHAFGNDPELDMTTWSR
jgi:peptidoglycan/xylan/chitin deacetylase (PgdA/CDA1 family)